MGAAAILFSIYSTLQLWNPRTIVVCSQRNLYAGSEFEISWLHQGSSSSIAELAIELEGEESATYRQGTTTRTDKSVFFKQIVVKTSEPTEISKGFRLVSLPADTMHSFQGSWQWHMLYWIHVGHDSLRCGVRRRVLCSRWWDPTGGLHRRRSRRSYGNVFLD